MIKYILHPGHVTGAIDNQKHYVSYTQLLRVYGLRPTECSKDRGKNNPPGAVHLYPRLDGDYRLPSTEH